jgi:ABC-type hemin transport system ATPase subunit
MLETTDLHVRLGGRAILDRVSLALWPGAVAAIRGLNGTGESTLLRARPGEIRSTWAVTLNGWMPIRGAAWSW